MGPNRFVCALGGLIAASALCAAEESPRRKEMFRAIQEKLPKFSDREPPAPAPESGAIPQAPADSGAAGMPNPATETPVRTPRSDDAEALVTMDEVRVTGRSLKDFKPAVPQTRESRPYQEVKLDPFLTGEAKDEALMQKHLNPIQTKILNPFGLFDAAYTDYARDAEAVEKAIAGQNEVADRINAIAASGTDLEELQKLREEFQKISVRRPR